MLTNTNDPFTSLEVYKATSSSFQPETDFLAIEEPLEIRLGYGRGTGRQVRNVSVTMRTPGNDAELAIGFLFTEGIIKSANQVSGVNTQAFVCAENKENTIQIDLKEDAVPHLNNTERNFYTTSSCGVCGKGSIAAIRTVSTFNENDAADIHISYETLTSLPAILYRQQEVFQNTGGLHACALFNQQGELILSKEDVGRHNALDKLIGSALQSSWLPLDKHIILLSGRASFELIQKAAMAGVTIVAAIGAPSSLAVSLAAEFNITLIGFLRDSRFNVYTHPHRIKI